MKLLFVLCVSFLSLFAATNISDFNIFDRGDRVDIMLSFDSPYTGNISKQSGNEYINLLLGDLYISEDIERSFNNNIIETLKIYQDGANVNILVGTKNNSFVVASKSAEGYGLRLRFALPKSEANSDVKSSDLQSEATTAQTPIDSVVQTQDIDYVRYSLVLGFLAILLLIMLFVRKRMGLSSSGTLTQSKNSWLFGAKGFNKDEIKILSQKQIDMKNKIVVFEAYTTRYIVSLSPNGTTLIDKIEKDTTIKPRNKFDAALHDSTEKLDSYLGVEDKGFEKLKRQASASSNSSLFESQG
ncbi:MAG: hypothetical protein ACOCP1_01405 [Campylobacterales bacterium]